MHQNSIFDQLDNDCRRHANLYVDFGPLDPSLPQRLVSAPEINSVLSHPSVTHDARDAAFARLLRLARAGDSRWVTATLSALSPALRNTMVQLTRKRCALEIDELEAEVVAGVTEAIYSMDLSRGRIASRLVWAGYRGGLAGEASESGRPQPVESVVESDVPPRPWGHPDLVLREAVAACALTEFDAELIGENRIQNVELNRLVPRLGPTVVALRRRRERAEERLVTWLRSPSRH